METSSKFKIAILGGTGKEGKGLAYRWALAGHEVIIGSRQLEKAQVAVDEILAICSKPVKLTANTNEKAAQMQEIAVLTVPYTAHQAMVESIKPLITSKLLIDVTVPLVPPKVTRVQIPEAGSAAMEALSILGEGSRVVSAFQNISYERLMNDQEIDCDVLVSGNDKESRELVIALAKDAGMRAWDAGPLENSIVAEGLTSILIHLNKKYAVEASGIRITGIPENHQETN
jgi:8-hydroxy-5-deazaflavin:NADPH oxidoreductase